MEQTQVVDTINNISSSSPAAQNIWFWIAIVEFLLIVASVVAINRKRKNVSKSELKKKVIAEGKIDFSNTMMSAFHSQKLYDQLKVKCHPDRFIQNPKLNAIATTLFQQIVENKNNYNKLLEIQEKASKQLNIKF